MEIRTKKILSAFVLSILLVGSSGADLAERINGCLSQSLQKKVNFSIHIVKADTDKTVYRHNSYTALVPASNMKLSSQWHR